MSSDWGRLIGFEWSVAREMLALIGHMLFDRWLDWSMLLVEWILYLDPLTKRRSIPRTTYNGTSHGWPFQRSTSEPCVMHSPSPWPNQLLSSVKYFDQLYEVFVTQFLRSRVQKSGSNYLKSIRQKVDELLKDYLERFDATMLEWPDVEKLRSANKFNGLPSSLQKRSNSNLSNVWSTTLELPSP